MLAPKRVKFRKRFKGNTNGLATRGNTVAFGHYGLMSLDPGWITNRQIEAARLRGATDRCDQHAGTQREFTFAIAGLAAQPRAVRHD